MNKITVSAPGKLMLLGEHAVLHGSPCIVTAVNQRMFVSVETINEPFFILDAPEVEIKNYKKPLSRLGKDKIEKGARFVEIAVLNFLSLYPQKSGFKITTKSQFSPLFGFGSSSASTVCTLKALSSLFKVNLDNKKLFDIAYKTVLDVQSTGSGFDVAAAIFGGTIYFITGGKVIKPLKVKSLPLTVGYSGTKADTTEMINLVSKKSQKFPRVIEEIYAQIAKLVDLSKKLIEKKDWQTLGELMNFNQAYLSALGVSTKKLDGMISAARVSGAYGAKLSGAGGGDCMIAIGSNPKIKSAIQKIGGRVINVKTNVEGVRVEK